MTQTPEKRRTEYQELRAAGLTDHLICMLRNTGATHAAILAWAARNPEPVKADRKSEREFRRAFTPNKHGEYA